MSERAAVGHSKASVPFAPEEETPGLEHTGERFVPGVTPEPEASYDHIVRYRFAERFVRDKRVVEMGSGAGYGAYFLSRAAGEVKAVDLSREAISHSASRYAAPNLSYEVGDVTRLPYEDKAFDVAVSFEVVEHLQDPEEMVAEAKRVLKDDGIFAVSSPDKQTYSNDRNRVNTHHLKEMYPLEFKELLERHFKHVQIYWQGALAGSFITPDRESLPEDGRADVESAQFSLSDPAFGDAPPITLYMIAFCTNGAPVEPPPRPYLALDYDRQIYEDFDYQRVAQTLQRMQHNYQMKKQRREANRQAEERLEKKDEQLAKAKEEIDRLRHEKKLMMNSRSWRLADRINVFQKRVRGVLSGGRGG